MFGISLANKANPLDKIFGWDIFVGHLSKLWIILGWEIEILEKLISDISLNERKVTDKSSMGCLFPNVCLGERP